MPNIITEGVLGDGWEVSQKLSEQHQSTDPTHQCRLLYHT